MAIPLSYSLRNLVARRTTTLMTALGIGLTVAVLASILALVSGLETSLRATAHPLHVLVMRKGATAELNSLVTNEQAQTIKFKPGIARDAQGQPMTSLELITIVVIESPENEGGTNLSVRGTTPQGIAMREEARIVEGRMFTPGRRECVVGRGVARRYPAAAVGRKLVFGRGEWDVVGVLDAGRSSANSEIFVDVNQIAADQNRQSQLSSLLVRAADEVAQQALINDLANDPRLNIDAITETNYYLQQTNSAAPIQYLGYFVSLIMAVGSCFAAMNTMYAAVARRAAEIGTLRVLGFSRLGILTSFVIESILLSLAGGAVGCILVLPLNNMSTGVGSFLTFSELTFEFTVTGRILASGMLFAIVMGAAGGLLPAASAARKEILAALRQV